MLKVFFYKGYKHVSESQEKATVFGQVPWLKLPVVLVTLDVWHLSWRLFVSFIFSMFSNLHGLIFIVNVYSLFYHYTPALKGSITCYHWIFRLIMK